MTLHMVRVRCDLPALYRRIARDHQEVDLGYAIHCHLREVFGDLAPQPFHVLEERSREVEVLGYCAHDRDTLEAGALSLGWRELASKPMPRIEPGRPLKFETRVCPTRRGRFPQPGSKGEPRRREVDAFLAETWKSPGERVDREAVYSNWIRERLEREEATRVLSVRMERLRRTRLFRRQQGADRKPKLLERPDVVLSGRLEVRDSEEFERLLTTGVGRHRAFGFGMLLLRAG